MADDNEDKMEIDPPSVAAEEEEEQEQKEDDGTKPDSGEASPDAAQNSEPQLQQQQQQQQQQLPESLIAGRSKRSTAGNRLAALLDREVVETDDIDLLFEENEDDDEFEGKEESDIELGSSSDEEDNAGGAANQEGDDELAGERELQREAKEERAKEKKRKAAKEAFLGQQQMKNLLGGGGARKQDSGGKPQKPKKVQIQEPHESSPADTGSPAESLLERQRKKSERISWIPTLEDKPSRQSTRRQTVANKKVTHQRLKEAEERRIKTINTMNEAMLRKKKDKQVVWTQEMRLEEAKKTEELNKKSLNKWEELEMQRAEARKAKLEALHNRKLKGPMITFYSKAAEWEDSRKLVEEVEDCGNKETTGKRRGRPRLADKDMDKATPTSNKEKTSSDEGQKDVAMVDKPKKAEDSKAKLSEAGTPKTAEASPKETEPSLNATAGATPKDSSINATAEATPKDSSLEVAAEATPKDSEATTQNAESPKETVLSTNETGETAPTGAQTPPKDAQSPGGDTTMEDAGAVGEKFAEDDKTDKSPNGAKDVTPNSENAGGGGSAPSALPEQKPAQKTDSSDVGANIYIDPAEKALPEPQEAAAKLVPNLSSRTFIILQNFDKEAIQTKEYQGKVLFPHNKGPITRPDRPLCVVTNLPARFRDPATGLPYANLFAYKQIQRVRSGEIRWSDTLQCFVGVQTEAAAGVPEGFLQPG